MNKTLVLQLNIVPAPTTDLLQCFGLPFYKYRAVVKTLTAAFCFLLGIKSGSRKIYRSILLKGERYEKYKNANSTRMGGRRNICYGENSKIKK